ncbi:MAG: hypothetical protein QXI12_11955 [Candidatus Methanomethyliaceae archaeon]
MLAYHIIQLDNGHFKIRLVDKDTLEVVETFKPVFHYVKDAVKAVKAEARQRGQKLDDFVFLTGERTAEYYGVLAGFALVVG